MNQLFQIGVMRFAFLMFCISSSHAVEISMGKAPSLAEITSKGQRRLMRSERKSRTGARDVVSERRAHEPSETIVDLKATQTAMSLLSKFRICGHESLMRVGPNRDGGYVIPNWPATSNMGTMFSIGIRGDDPVSHEISDKFGVAAHLYDCFSGPSPCPADLTRCNVTFHHVCAGARDSVNQGQTIQSIQSMVQQQAPGASNNLILKIDCEGCEWDAFDLLPVATLNRFKLLITEMHWLEQTANHKKYLRVMTKLTQNFAIVHTHACNCFGQVHLTGKAGQFNIPKIVETTFVRKDLLTSSQDCSVEADYRTGLDVPICSAQCFPICLNNTELREGAFKLPVA